MHLSGQVVIWKNQVGKGGMEEREQDTSLL